MFNLQSFIESRAGYGGTARIPYQTAATLHGRFSAMAGERRRAAEALSSGQSIRYLGSRLDAASLTSRGHREAALLAAEHVAAGTPLGVAVREMAMAKGRMDAAIPMASQGLVSIYKQVYEIQHAELSAWSGMICKIDTTVDPAAEQYAWYETDVAAAMRAASTYDTTTIPMVNGPVAAQNTGFIVPGLVGWETIFMDDRRSALGVRNGKPDFQIEARKIAACKEVLAQATNAIWLVGDPSRQIDGLHTSPVINSVTAPAGPWSGLSLQALLGELSKLFNWIPNVTQGGLPDAQRVRLLLPPQQYDLITTPTFLPGGLQGPSPWQTFRDSKGLTDKNLVKVHEFAAANSAVVTGGAAALSADRAYIVYDKGDIDDPHFIQSQPIEVPAAPRMTGLGEVMYMHTRMGGIKIADARRIWFYEGL